MNRIEFHYLEIPEYQVSVYEGISQDSPYTRWGKPVPREYEENKPDFELVSRRLKDLLRANFMNETIALRLISSTAHENKSLKELIEIIKRTGTDRYDPNRKGDRYDNMENVVIDFFALDLLIGKEQEENCIKDALESFYYYPILHQDRPIKIDLGIVYDIGKIRSVNHKYIGREEVKKDGFVFIDPQNRKDAIRAIIAIL